MNAPWAAMFQSCDLLLRGKQSPRRVYRACTDRIRNVSDNISFGADRDVVGISRGAVSGQLMVSDQAARSIV
jgi:hypothetical protein